MVENLLNKIERLQAKVEEYEAIFQAKCTTPPGWGLTRTEARIFACLLINKIATKEQIETAMYLHSDNAKGFGGGTLQVLLCRLRKKLRPHGVKIHSIWGVGYSMSGRRLDDEKV